MLQFLEMQNAEFVQFKTADGLTLPGLLFGPKGSNKAVIYLHGNGSSSVFYSDDYSLASELNKNGIAMLLFNNRGAGLIKKLNVLKSGEIERKRFGCAYEKIKECVEDIDAAIAFLEQKGYQEFYLMGLSTGANKICVYDHYHPQNKINKYILLAGGDDTGIYYNLLGEEKFNQLLKKSKEMIKKLKSEELISELMPENIFSYKGFYDISNPDGDYNTFPFYEKINNVKLSKKPLFRYFKSIARPSLVIYGELDEYAWGDVPKIVNILKDYRPEFAYEILKGADHSFTGKKKELAEIVIKWLNL